MLNQKQLATIILILFFFFPSLLSSQSNKYFKTKDLSYSSRQLLPAGHWVYDAMLKLYAENKMCSLADNAPMSVGQLKTYFSRLNYDVMSESGKKLYIKTYEYLYNHKRGYLGGKFDFSSAFFAINAILTTQFLFKTNKNLDWSFSTDYTGHIKYPCYTYTGETASPEYPVDSKNISINNKCYKTHKANGEYKTLGTFNSSDFNKELITIPVMLGWGDIFMIESDIVLAQSLWGYDRDDTFCNVFTNPDYLEFYEPRWAYGAIGYDFKNWGFSATASRTGLEIGRTLTGSIIYNHTFDTQFFFQLNVYCQYMLYNMDVIQIEPSKFLYLHQIEVTPWKWLKLGVIEGTLINEPFEMRFLNPLMIMHAFGAWTEYSDSKEEDIYGESHVCAYLAALMDITPCRNFRLYALYAQNEMQAPWELGSASSKAIPDGFGWQVGFEVNVPYKENYFTIAAEGVYTTPFLYLKQGATWCLTSRRTDFSYNSDIPLYSWVGTPFGPDAVGVQVKFNYEYLHKWKAQCNYLFVAHGTNSFGMLDSFYTDVDGRSFSSYYPSVLHHIGIYDDDKAADVARDNSLTGTISYTNSITFLGYYQFNNHFRIDAALSTIFAFNYHNKGGNTQAGVEGSVSLRYNVF